MPLEKKAETRRREAHMADKCCSRKAGPCCSPPPVVLPERRAGAVPHLAEASCCSGGVPVFDGMDPRYKRVLWAVIGINGSMFLAEMIGATSLNWPVWVNILAALGALVILVAAFGLLNGFRGRPFWSLPTAFLTGARLTAVPRRQFVDRNGSRPRFL